ncbi:MAG: hypothetical protein HN380_21230, partial [Victivallales bacterium]|nr:hypothetical protein [Victivallales bacterium]
MSRWICLAAFASLCLLASPFDAETRRLTAELQNPDAGTRAGAAEALGYLRATMVAERLVTALGDSDTGVRRNAALSLAWCGRRRQIPPLLDALSDPDWSVRQSAAVALANLTGQDLPFDALADTGERAAQETAWRQWWHRLPANGIPPECREILSAPTVRNLATGCAATASTTYKGPVSALTDPNDGSFWQTKNVPCPQYATIDLGKRRRIGYVAVSQYDERFCMTDYELSVSDDGTRFESILRKRKLSPATLGIAFVPRAARYVRIISHASKWATYPTTWRSVEIYASKPKLVDPLPRIRAARALAALGGPGDSPLLVQALQPYRSRTPTEAEERQSVQTALRALGRTGGPEALDTLCAFLKSTHFARYAADALGELGDAKAIAPLIAAYPLYARPLNRSGARHVPRDDVPKLEPIDRMYETPYAIAAALSRLAGNSHRDQLLTITPLLLANIPGDFDGMMLYEPEAGHRVTAHLIELAGLRQVAVAIALRALGCEGASMPGAHPELVPTIQKLAVAAPGDVPYGATWLCALALPDEYTAELRHLLRHPNGWVRINAAKALLFTTAREARPDIVSLLKTSKPEAAYGYNGKFLFRTKSQGQDEYNAPSPCWREAFTRSLAVLGTEEDVPLLHSLLEDDRNVLEVQTAAAEALAGIGGDEAITTLRKAARAHPFHSVRLLARERLTNQGIPWEAPMARPTSPVAEAVPEPGAVTDFVFIRGPNAMPNDFQIDIWRQTYSTTDTGPTYRLGRSLWVLEIGDHGPQTQCLVDAGKGWVADCEVSWDGTRIIFAQRGGDSDPWWHLYEVRPNGSGFRQLTRGPYHDVGPTYLPDGRIVFSTSRSGARDEYHGYPATGLAVMQPDGSGIHCIGFNVGRDDEPAIMPDGRIVFGRLELFYSRLKTERTLHAVFPDGTGDVTLYGPERREFWRQITAQSKERWWAEVAPRHRVL